MLTAMDIHNREFKRSFRGYNEDEIDDFLDQVVNDYEKLSRDNEKLKEDRERSKKDHAISSAGKEFAGYIVGCAENCR